MPSSVLASVVELLDHIDQEHGEHDEPGTPEYVEEPLHGAPPGDELCGWQDSNLRLPDPCQVLYRYSDGEGVRLVPASPMFPLSYTHSRDDRI